MNVLITGLNVPPVAGEVFQLGGPGPFTWEEAVPYMADKLELDYDIFAMIDSEVRARQGNEPDVVPTHV